ncbi:MAG: hydrogenase 4 subunit F [Candidatus Omnitrophota bacterium]|nr:hydrogenase 4 subunit F [Candidatus Omnitrophota bacterium]
MFILVILFIPFALSIISLFTPLEKVADGGLKLLLRQSVKDGGSLTGFIKKERLFGIINAFGYAIVLGISLLLTARILTPPYVIRQFGIFYIDALSAFFMLITAIIAFSASIYSIGYISNEIEEAKISFHNTKVYYCLFNLFCFSMLLAPMLNNLALVWIVIEMTTLISAFLVGFHNVKESIEAAWKYVIICSVGITFALLGIIFFYYTASKDAHVTSLHWLKMYEAARFFNPHTVKIALIFIFVGYGTKAGLAPMHSWLPDAHSQALSPVSGLLSGVLLKISLYAILRFVILAIPSLGYAFSAQLFILFGLCSLFVSAGFILVQKDLKRLLAYSSIEHIGLVSIAFGLGPVAGIYAGLLHIFNHAVTKAFMFFCAGDTVKAYRTNNMNLMQGMFKIAPFTAGALLLGVFALTGSPPFSIFISKILIILAAFGGKRYAIAAVMLLLLAVVFAGLLQHITKIVFGNKPQNMIKIKEPLSTKAAVLFLAIFIVWFGMKVPVWFSGLLSACGKIISG